MELSRREFLKIAGMTGIVAAVSPLELIAEDKTISEEEVKKLMERENVEAILKEESDAGLVQYVTYDPTTKSNNYEELVFQEKLPAKERKPVVVMLYANMEQKNFGTRNRTAILFKHLIREYSEKIKFVCFEQETDPNLAADNYDLLRKTMGYQAPPSFGLFNKFDLTKGEAVNNAGRIKQIDILKGGPKDNSFIEEWRVFLSSWIETNITNPNGKYALRCNNSANEKEVNYVLR